MQKTYIFSIRLDQPLKIALENLASNTGCSQGQLVRELLKREARVQGLIPPDPFHLQPKSQGETYG